ncbi:hypothetical protein [Chryseobacterium sp. M5A1_1a]
MKRVFILLIIVNISCSNGQKKEDAKNQIKESTETTKLTTVFPIDFNNFAEKVKLEIPTNDNIQNPFKKKYRLGIDAMAKIPSNGNYDLYLVNNVSGDSELVYIITWKDGKLIDGLEIANSNGDSDETTVFAINEKYEISIYSEKNNTRKLTDLYSLNDKGNFEKK